MLVFLLTFQVQAQALLTQENDFLKTALYYENLIKTEKFKSLISDELFPKLNKKVLVVHFWSTTCPSCLSELNSIGEFIKRNSSKVEFIGIHAVDFSDKNQQQKISSIKAFIKKNDLKMNVSYDQNAKATGLFHVESLPTTFTFVNGKLFKIHDEAYGFVDKKYLKILNDI